ncbi:heavy metal translocating P-type ATPase [Sphingobacterium lumbrici]|uniref:heavy metal translocating P-type ATPase n=1 Tax=Sphingobacterium lumbrici TaxID=2559600 RepID=UPI001129F9C8|nr:heavy metal translocating P-type ATPase [Sphingobacterium lumbrici]
MQHKHNYIDGVCTICSQTTNRTYTKADNACCVHTCDHSDNGHQHSESMSTFYLFVPAVISLILLLFGIGLDHYVRQSWFNGTIRFFGYLIAYIPVGLPVLKQAVGSISRGNLFSEFFLMGIATLGAFAINEYPEGVAVMLFYTIGENFQSLAITRAKANIKMLLDQRPDEATVYRDGDWTKIKAAEVNVGDRVQVKPGEKLGLDGVLSSDKAIFNTAALTGESKPEGKNKGDVVLAGMINLYTAIQMEVTAVYEDSKLSKILQLTQEASSQKAPTELFISKFAKIYTPIVVFLAISIIFFPFLFVDDYVFRDWLYRALVFLVISCPCALVISIPLGYFGGIGAASRNGILIKGGNFLDVLASLKHVVMDKTGTMTEGVFDVQDVQFNGVINRDKILSYINVLESYSTHPVATAIHKYVGEIDKSIHMERVEEIAGYGLKGIVENKVLLVGNFRLLDSAQIKYDTDLNSIAHTTIAVAFNGIYIGYMTIADKIKGDAKETIDRLHDMQLHVTMLSGDKSSIVRQVAEDLGIDQVFGDLLPEDKVNRFKTIKQDNVKIAFVGDGINDAPVVALSDVGIAMGGLGSDATIETADVVIQDDRPIKIPLAIHIGKKTKQIVWQNISFAFGVKIIVLILGAGGLATMWEAVFADVGIALLAIFNAIRIQHIKF